MCTLDSRTKKKSILLERARSKMIIGVNVHASSPTPAGNNPGSRKPFHAYSTATTYRKLAISSALLLRVRSSAYLFNDVPGIPQRIIANVRSHLKLPACCTCNDWPLKLETTSPPTQLESFSSRSTHPIYIDKSTTVAVHIITSKPAMPFCSSPALVQFPVLRIPQKESSSPESIIKCQSLDSELQDWHRARAVHRDGG